MFNKPDVVTHEKFTDPKTGELVTRMKTPEKYYKPIEEAFNANGQHAQAFLQLARGTVINLKQLIKEFDLATAGEEAVQKHVVSARERMGLDSSWIYNVPLKMMEKREPPDPSAIDPNKLPGESIPGGEKK